MRRWLILVLTATLTAALLSGCNQDVGEVPEEKSSASSSAESSTESSRDIEIKPVSSSLTSPLSLEEWGNASKFSPETQKYYTVPVRVVKVTAGEEAEKKVRSFTGTEEAYTYKEPEKGCRWVTADYELCLDGFPSGKSGADAQLVSFVTGTDGGTLEYNGKKYAVTTICMTDGEYSFEGIVKGSIAFAVPEGFIDYTIALGEYGETQAFFTQSENTGFEIG